jgi:hypothetical protein
MLASDFVFGADYPLIPAFSAKGEKESEAHDSYERTGRSDSPSRIEGEGWGEGAGRPKSPLQKTDIRAVVGGTLASPLWTTTIGNGLRQAAGIDMSPFQ